MSRLIRKNGFTLAETVVVLVILSGLFALGIGMFNSSHLNNETLAAKQLKLESALRTATLAIINDDKLSVDEACDPAAMRDKYAEKLNGTSVDNVRVNGKEVAALEIKGYGVLAFDASANCKNSWYATGSSVYNYSENSDDSVSSQSSTQEQTYIESPTDLAKAVVVYSSLDAAQSKSGSSNVIDIAVPATVAATGKSSASSLTDNTMAFNVNSKSITNTYTSAPVLLAAASNSYDNDINVCNEGANYAYTSGSCADISVAFYQMLNEATCARSFCPGNGYDNNNNLITSGQINLLCKYGTGNGNVGQCSCPEGKQFWAGVYGIDNSTIFGICVADCSELGMVQSGTTNTCTCPDGTEWNNELKQCITPGTCPYEYLKYDPATASCICKTESELGSSYFDVCEEWVNNPSVECKQLKANWDKTSGTCVCPSPFTQVGTNCSCLSPRTLTGSECVCDSTKVSLTGEEIFDATSSTCKFDCASISQIANTNKDACITPDCGCLKKYDFTTKSCVCDSTQAGSTTCINPDESYDENSPTCKSCTYSNREYDAAGACVCKAKSALTLGIYEIYDTTKANCIYTCKDGAVANSDHTACIGDCLQEYDYTTETLNCITNPTDAKTTECLQNTNYVSDPTAATCKVECSALTSPNGVHKVCECNAIKVATALNQPGNLNKIFDLNNAPACMMACQGQTFPNTDRMSCRPVDCLYETTDNITQHCIANPTDLQTTTCLANTNFVSDPTAATCKVECTGLTSPNGVYKQCACDNSKVTTYLNQSGNEDKIYAMNDAPTCVYTCKDGAVANSAKNQCIGDCLQEYDYTTEKLNCITNPTDAKTTECLQNTNFVSDPSAATCKVECSALTSPNGVHKVCECNQTKVAAALVQSGNLNKIYALNNAPACMAPCTGQTYPSDDRTYCRPVDCLYETTDNITQHCIANPTDAQTTACLANTNYKSNPSMLTCKEDCGTRRSPNNVYKTCECDVNKMATLYTSDNMKFDAAAATCESACPSSFTFRDASNPATCKCPAVRPSQVTVKNGYYYDASSTVLSGTYACQLQCPTAAASVTDWITVHAPLFTSNKTIYDSTKAGCLSQCTGNYIASTDKLGCVCGISANSCQPGTYFDSNSCECKTCPVGHYCPGVTPENPTGGIVPCPCGTYGAVTGLSTAACSGQCPSGYYCPQASVSPTQHACTAGNICPTGACQPTACTFPATNNSGYTACSQCQTEAQIKSVNPNYFGTNEIYVNDLSLQCKKCMSNMEYNTSGVCECPASKPYWDGTQCNPCQNWGKLFFSRTSSNKPDCKLYDHMMGKKGACFDFERVPSDEMKQAANALSNADRNRTFNGVYAYMISYKNGQSSVVGVFTARSWYMTFPADDSSEFTKKSTMSDGSCTDVCGSNTECKNTCEYMKGKVTQNTMFASCSYAVNNKFRGNTYNNGSDELCTGGQIKVTNPNQCTYQVGGILRNVISPIVLDLKGNGFKFTSVEEGVVFDLNNDGVPEKTAWTGKQKAFDNAFLVLDKNKNGQVDNGGELFGDQNGAANGFMELAKYDENGDKVINKEDKVFNELLLWVDFNNNGKVDYEADGTTKELKTLSDAGVTELSVNYKVQKDSNGNILSDMYGNITGFVGSFKMMIKNAVGKLVEVVGNLIDVFFVTQ